jgi:hypothetical protein
MRSEWRKMSSIPFNPSHTVDFILPDSYNLNLTLLIDPELGCSTYLGDLNDEEGLAIAASRSGNAYLTS